MLKKVLISLAVFIVTFGVLVSSRPDTFTVSRSGVILAPPGKIYPYLSNFKLGEQWSPFDSPDMKLKKTFSGNDGEVGSSMKFEGDMSTGSGELTFLKLVPNELVYINLHMTSPMDAQNLVEYSLLPESGGTKFTWTMSGKNNFIAKMFSLFMDCEKMIGPEFEKGIANLKRVAEAQK